MRGGGDRSADGAVVGWGGGGRGANPAATHPGELGPVPGRDSGLCGAGAGAGAEAELEERRWRPLPRCTLTAGAPRALPGQERNRGRRARAAGRGRSARLAAGCWLLARAGRARAARGGNAACTWLTARTCARGWRAPLRLVLWPRRVLSRWDPPIPVNPAGEGSSKFPTRGGGGGAGEALWEAEPGGVARAPYKSAIGTWRGPRGGGRWPCDVAGVAEFGCSVPGCPAPGAGKLPFAPLSLISIP